MQKKKKKKKKNKKKKKKKKKKLPQMNHFGNQKKKNLLGGIGINVLNLRKKFVIIIHLRFLSEELGNGETLNIL